MTLSQRIAAAQGPDRSRDIQRETKAILNDAGRLDQWRRDNDMQPIVDGWLGMRNQNPLKK